MKKYTPTKFKAKDSVYDKTKADGIKFAMIRLGYGSADGNSCGLDGYFEKNVANALRAGINIGCYFYSYATSVAAAKKEAAYVVSVLQKYKGVFTYHQCHNPGIRDETMKRLVTDVLGLDEFDEAAMDAQIENATILDHTVTFHFRDGHTESREFLDKRHGTPWTEERREKARESMKAAWTDERKEAMSERIKKIRSEKKWPNP